MDTAVSVLMTESWIRARQHHRVVSPHPGLSLFLRHLPPRNLKTDRVVLCMCTAEPFRPALSIAHRFDGRSWRDELNDAGFHAWGLDFHGFGLSDPLSGDGAGRRRPARRSAAPKTRAAS